MLTVRSLYCPAAGVLSTAQTSRMRGGRHAAASHFLYVCTGLSSGWQIGVSLSLAYICLVSGIGPWTIRARPPSAVSNSFCFVSALDRYSSLPVRAPCSGKSRRVVAAAASVTIWATDVSP